MSRILIILALLFAALAAACDGAGSAALPSSSRTTEPPAVVVIVPSASEVPSDATTTPPAEEATTPERPPPARVPPRTLAVAWQSYLGRRVSLACKPVRRIDFVRTLVVANGARFVVLGSPELVPCSPRTSTFTVMGASSVSLGGRTALPELLLEDNDEDDTR